MKALPEKLRNLELAVHGAPQALLAKRSVYSLMYQPDARQQLGLGLPVADRAFQDGNPVRCARYEPARGLRVRAHPDALRQVSDHQMHLLALMGAAGIGRLAYQLPGEAPLNVAQGPVSRAELPSDDRSAALFEELVDPLMGLGSGLAGVQPKIMVPVVDKAVMPGSNMIVKAEGCATRT